MDFIPPVSVTVPVLLVAWSRSAVVMRKDPEDVDAGVDAAAAAKAANHAVGAAAHLGVKCDFNFMMKEMAMRMEATSRQ